MYTAKQLADKIADLVLSTRVRRTHGNIASAIGPELCFGDLQYVIDPPNICVFAGASGLFLDAVDILRSERKPRVVLDSVPEMLLIVSGTPVPDDIGNAMQRPSRGRFKLTRFVPVAFVPADAIKPPRRARSKRKRGRSAIR